MTAVASPAFVPAPSLSRLFVVELRKSVDTRAGFWLLLSSALLAVTVVGLTLAFGNQHEQAFGVFFGRTVGAVGVLLPVLGILAISSEWSQRTALTTFALVPRRFRVIAAKLLAGVALALAAVAVCLVTSLLATALGHGDATWDVAPAALGAAVLFMAIWMVAGAGLGLLLMSSAPAIVLSFLIPIAIDGLASGVPGAERGLRWFDLGTASGELNGGHPALSGQDWAQLASSAAVWVFVPLALGLLRLRRREVTSS